MNPIPVPLLTLYFDGGCPVCSREIGFYQRRRGAERIHWVNLAQCEDSDLGTDLSREAAYARLHARWPDTSLPSGQRACRRCRRFARSGAWPHCPASCTDWNGAIGVP